ncbi:MAG TPA: zf-HC2 domain-containing protein [Streptosporangiaceae bacterium]|nr:zf-HC2 domain-containing protein [Streptosporangiaceae bacterium]
MSHLGRRLSALIDGELSDAERDQVHAHLVGCDECRAEAAALRTLKRRVHGLGETPADGALTSRLIALAALGEPPPPRPRFLAAPRVWGEAGDWDDHASPFTGHDGEMTPAASTGRDRGQVQVRPGHTKYLVAGAVAAALAVSLGTASFAAGGGGQAPGPRVVPEVDVYSFEQAVTVGGEPPLYRQSTAPAVNRPGGSKRP